MLRQEERSKRAAGSAFAPLFLSQSLSSLCAGTQLHALSILHHLSTCPAASASYFSLKTALCPALDHLSSAVISQKPWGFLYVHKGQEMQRAARCQGQLSRPGGTRGMASKEWRPMGSPAPAKRSTGLACGEQLFHSWGVS